MLLVETVETRKAKEKNPMLTKIDSLAKSYQSTRSEYDVIWITLDHLGLTAITNPGPPGEILLPIGGADPDGKLVTPASSDIWRVQRINKMRTVWR